MKPIIYKNRPTLKGNPKIVDAYTSSKAELFYVRNPKYKKGTKETETKLKLFLRNKFSSCWIHYQEDNILIHSLDEKEYFELRTARNKNLITETEQKKYRNLSVGIAGLSVGSNILSAIVMSGGPKRIKIADFDTIEITNLNRIKATLKDIGKNKIAVAAHGVWDLDPFAELTLFDKGISDKNLTNFILGKPKLNFFIDEMDSIPMKIKARYLCKKNRIPVLMATDNGDSVILDVERYDLEPNRKIFHGLLPNLSSQNLQTLNYKDWLKLATKIVSAELLTGPMQESLLLIGKDLPAVPQLGATASVAGAAVSLVLRSIASGKSVPSGRYIISLEEKINPSYFDKSEIMLRNKKTKNFKLHFEGKL